ncbi:hypothetical protein [Cyanobium sp. NIES-981]|uniref:hypothetical protein n=1 Tax=Cyanobium sp. NIES-981 TaxID=1851505 RepID=UPI0007DD421D|nr:conserved exported protein of unknown function [Cyanobium sp. NIES-981]
MPLRRCVLSLGLLVGSGVLPGLPGGAGATADVVFDDCRPTADGGVSCDTRPTGDTLLNDEAARFGLFDAASPGWSEFEPFEADDDMLGGNGT